MSNLCSYKDIFGKPGQGIHQYRLFNIAIFDFVGAILLAIGIYYLLPKKLQTVYNLVGIILLVFLSGIIFHRLFCVRTTVDKLLFL